MTSKKTHLDLSDETIKALAQGDPDALVEQKLVSTQNYVLTSRRTYEQSLKLRGEIILLAHEAGWSKYRIAKTLDLTPKAIDEALSRTTDISANEVLDREIKTNGDLVNPGDRKLRERINRRFGNGWILEDSVNGKLRVSLFTRDPLVDSSAPLHSITEFNSDTRETSTLMRTGTVIPGVGLDWETWEDC